MYKGKLEGKYQLMFVLLLEYFPGLTFFTTRGNPENKVERKNNGRNWPCIVENKGFQPSNKCGEPVQSSLSAERMRQL